VSAEVCRDCGGPRTLQPSPVDGEVVLMVALYGCDRCIARSKREADEREALAALYEAYSPRTLDTRSAFHGERDEVSAWHLDQFLDHMRSHLDPSGHFHMTRREIGLARYWLDKLQESRVRVQRPNEAATPSVSEVESASRSGWDAAIDRALEIIEWEHYPREMHQRISALRLADLRPSEAKPDRETSASPIGTGESR